MNTPIFDFVKSYSEMGLSRFHMPGHKGHGALGIEHLDITEISGADVLYSPTGIIAESENNASLLFGTAHSFYSTEGSTLAIKAMLAIIKGEKAKKSNTPPLILAARNVHKAFVYTAALLDLDVTWIYPEVYTHLCECNITPEDLRRAIKESSAVPDAVYVTSPDYLGNIADVKGLATVCDEYSVPLLVDNAHGAYLAFCEPNLHPISLGAAMCADSAHKTLPVLTGGAYLHVSEKYSHFKDSAREALSLFASTSPSYLTLASLDACNAYIATDFRERLDHLINRIEILKSLMNIRGCPIRESEPLKLVISSHDYGCRVEDLLSILRKNKIEHEFNDDDLIVLMLSPENDDDDFKNLCTAVDDIVNMIKQHGGVRVKKIAPKSADRAVSAMRIRDAVFAPGEIINVKDAVGRICKDPTVSCPPAVPIVVSGEIISDSAIELFRKYGITQISVVKNNR